MKIHQRLPGNLTEEDFSRVIDDYNDPKIEITTTKINGRGWKVQKGSALGESFDSKAEYAWFLWQTKINGIGATRNHFTSIDYIDEHGKKRKWFPDFESAGKLVEIKGRVKPSDECKKLQHPEVDWYDWARMTPIISEVNKKFPGWQKDYILKTAR